MKEIMWGVQMACGIPILLPIPKPMDLKQSYKLA